MRRTATNNMKKTESTRKEDKSQTQSNPASTSSDKAQCPGSEVNRAQKVKKRHPMCAKLSSRESRTFVGLSEETRNIIKGQGKRTTLVRILSALAKKRLDAALKQRWADLHLSGTFNQQVGQQQTALCGAVESSGNVQAQHDYHELALSTKAGTCQLPMQWAFKVGITNITKRLPNTFKPPGKPEGVTERNRYGQIVFGGDRRDEPKWEKVCAAYAVVCTFPTLRDSNHICGTSRAILGCMRTSDRSSTWTRKEKIDLGTHNDNVCDRGSRWRITGKVVPQIEKLQKKVVELTKTFCVEAFNANKLNAGELKKKETECKEWCDKTHERGRCEGDPYNLLNKALEVEDRERRVKKATKKLADAKKSSNAKEIKDAENDLKNKKKDLENKKREKENHSKHLKDRHKFEATFKEWKVAQLKIAKLQREEEEARKRKAAQAGCTRGDCVEAGNVKPCRSQGQYCYRAAKGKNLDRDTCTKMCHSFFPCVAAAHRCRGPNQRFRTKDDERVCECKLLTRFKGVRAQGSRDNVFKKVPRLPERGNHHEASGCFGVAQCPAVMKLKKNLSDREKEMYKHLGIKGKCISVNTDFHNHCINNGNRDLKQCINEMADKGNLHHRKGGPVASDIPEECCKAVKDGEFKKDTTKSKYSLVREPYHPRDQLQCLVRGYQDNHENRAKCGCNITAWITEKKKNQIEVLEPRRQPRVDGEECPAGWGWTAEDQNRRKRIVKGRSLPATPGYMGGPYVSSGDWNDWTCQVMELKPVAAEKQKQRHPKRPPSNVWRPQKQCSPGEPMNHLS